MRSSLAGAITASLRDVINYQSGQSNQVSYTFTGGNGFSAMIGAGQGQDDVTSLGGQYVVEDYMPYVLAGAKFERNWGGSSGVVGYDSNVEEFAGSFGWTSQSTTSSRSSSWKAISPVMTTTLIRTQGDVDQFSRNWFGTWEGDWAAWEDEGTAFALNLEYELVPGFVITSEFNYTKFDGAREAFSIANGGDDDAFGGTIRTIRFQRNF